MNKLTLAFFDIMIRKGRERLLYDAAREFGNQYNSYKGIVQASVTSASELTEEHLGKVREVIRKITPGDVQLANKIDKSLIGGFVLRVGAKQYDASKIGRASCRERLSESVWITVVAVSFKKKNKRK